MVQSQHIEVAVDDSTASQLAVDRAAELVRAGSNGTHVRLFHVVGPIPPALLEHGGAEDPEEERRKGSRQRREIEAWVEEQRAAARGFLDGYVRRLVEGGVAEEDVQVEVSRSIPEDDIAHLVVEDAKENGCSTIVVGREAWPWFKELFQAHLHERILQLSDEDAVRLDVVPDLGPASADKGA
jgi:hypothetical protein